MTRSPLFALAAGIAALLGAASYFGRTLFEPGPYRATPWAHLAALPILALAAVVVARRGRWHGLWPRRLVAWVGAAAAVASAAVVWLFVFVGSRLPAKAPPRLETAPSFALEDQDGGLVKLTALRARGPVVVAFFRGGFDPWGRAALSDLERGRARIEAAGGTIVAISGDPRGDLRGLRRRLGLGYPLLSDSDLDTSTRWEVLDAAARAPRPAVFVVTPDGRIAWSHWSRSLGDLPHPDEVAAAVESLRAAVGGDPR